MYHCIIKDIVTGDVLGDHMAERMTKELVINAMLTMLARHELKAGCFFITTGLANTYQKL